MILDFLLNPWVCHLPLHYGSRYAGLLIYGVLSLCYEFFYLSNVSNTLALHTRIGHESYERVLYIQVHSSLYTNSNFNSEKYLQLYRINIWMKEIWFYIYGAVGDVQVGGGGSNTNHSNSH